AAVPRLAAEVLGGLLGTQRGDGVDHPGPGGDVDPLLPVVARLADEPDHELPTLPLALAVGDPEERPPLLEVGSAGVVVQRVPALGHHRLLALDPQPTLDGLVVLHRTAEQEVDDRTRGLLGGPA